MNTQEREQIARNIERYYIRLAGVLRNRIIEGKNFEEAKYFGDYSFWMETIEREGKKLSAK